MIAKYLRKAGKQSLVYGIGNLINRVIGFLLIPVYTRVLSTQEYGVLALLTITLSVAAIVITMGMQLTMFRFYSYDYSSTKDRKNLISTIIIFLHVAMIVILSVLIKFSDNFSSLLFNSNEYGFYIKLIFVASFFEVIAAITLSILRAQEKSKIFSLYSIIRFLLQLLFILYFVVVEKQGVLGVVKGILISLVILYFLNLVIIFKNIDFKFSFGKLKKVLRYGLPLMPAALATWAMTMIDRFMLGKMADISQVGVYTIGYNMGMIISFVFVAPIQLAWPSIMWQILKKEKSASRIFSYLTTYYILVGVFLASGVILLSEDFLRVIVTPEYFSAISIIPIITVSYIVYGTFFMINIGIIIQKKTEIIAASLAASAAVNILLNIKLIPTYGINGAAMATLVTFIFLIIVMYFINRHFYKVEYQWKRIIKILSFFIFIILAYFSLPDMNIYISIAIRIFIPFLIFPMLYLLKFFEKREIEKTINFLKPFYFKLIKTKQ